MISFSFLSSSSAPLDTSGSTSAQRERRISKSMKKCSTARVGRQLIMLLRDSMA